MKLTEATQILTNVDNKTWEELEELYSIDYISNALELIYLFQYI